VDPGLDKGALMSDGAAKPHRGSQVIERLEEFIKDIGIGIAANASSPFKVIQFSFIIAFWLCLFYAIALPTKYFIDTGRILLSDVSIYYLLGAICMYLTTHVFEIFDQ
jgi:hypothetical protein